MEMIIMGYYYQAFVHHGNYYAGIIHHHMAHIWPHLKINLFVRPERYIFHYCRWNNVNGILSPLFQSSVGRNSEQDPAHQNFINICLWTVNVRGVQDQVLHHQPRVETSPLKWRRISKLQMLWCRSHFLSYL